MSPKVQLSSNCPGHRCDELLVLVFFPQGRGRVELEELPPCSVVGAYSIMKFFSSCPALLPSQSMLMSQPPGIRCTHDGMQNCRDTDTVFPSSLWLWGWALWVPSVFHCNNHIYIYTDTAAYLHMYIHDASAPLGS